MVYYNLKVVFPHIVKTGGSTLEYHLGQVDEPEIFEKYKNVKRHMTFLNVLYKKNQFEPEHRRWNIHRYAKQYKKELGNEWDNFYKFSIVRNPFSQIKSLYDMDTEDRKRRGKETISWEDYILGDHKWSISNIRFHLDQHALLTENNELIVDEVFPFEYYEEVVKKIGKKLNFKPDFGVKLWSTKPKHDYTPEMVERVLDLYPESYNLWRKVKKSWEKYKIPYGASKKSSSSSTS